MALLAYQLLLVESAEASACRLVKVACTWAAEGPHHCHSAAAHTKVTVHTVEEATAIVIDQAIATAF